MPKHVTEDSLSQDHFEKMEGGLWRTKGNVDTAKYEGDGTTDESTLAPSVGTTTTTIEGWNPDLTSSGVSLDGDGKWLTVLEDGLYVIAAVVTIKNLLGSKTNFGRLDTVFDTVSGVSTYQGLHHWAHDVGSVGVIGDNLSIPNTTFKYLSSGDKLSVNLVVDLTALGGINLVNSTTRLNVYRII